MSDPLQNPRTPASTLSAQWRQELFREILDACDAVRAKKPPEIGDKMPLI